LTAHRDFCCLPAGNHLSVNKDFSGSGTKLVNLVDPAASFRPMWMIMFAVR
jgi:hypothetical protein